MQTQPFSDEMISLINKHYPGGIKYFCEMFNQQYYLNDINKRHNILTDLINILHEEKNDLGNILKISNNKSQHYFPGNTIKCSIFVNLKQSNTKSVQNMWNVLLNGNVPEHDKPHLTLFECEFNNKHCNWKSFDFDTFCNSINTLYINSFLEDCTLICDTFELLGRQQINKFFVQTYDKTNCTTSIGNHKINFVKFKTDFFKIIKNMFGIYSSRQDDKYKIYSVNNEVLLAVPEYYTDTNWNPHVTIVNIGDIQKSNNKLYSVLTLNDMLKTDACKIMSNTIKNNKIGDINMTNDIESITIKFKGVVYNAEQTINF